MEVLWYKYPFKLFHSSTCFTISRLPLQNQCLSLRQLLAGMRGKHQFGEKWSWFCLRVCFNCSSPCSKPYGLSSREFICKLTSSITLKIVVWAQLIHPKLFTGHLLSVTSPATYGSARIPAKKTVSMLPDLILGSGNWTWERTKQKLPGRKAAE